MSQRGYPRYPQDQYDQERQQYPADRNVDLEDNDPYSQERQRYPADRDTDFRERERRPGPYMQYDRDDRDWRQAFIQSPDSDYASGNSCELCSEMCGNPEGHGARQEKFYKKSRPRHDLGPAGHGGRVLGGSPRRDYGPVFDIWPGRLPRMDGPALDPWSESPLRRREGPGYGGTSERQEDTEGSFRGPPTTGGEYIELIAASQGGGGSYRGGHGGSGRCRGSGGGGGRHEGLPLGVRYVRPRDFEEIPKV